MAKGSVSLRNTPSISELWGVTLTHTYSNSLTYQTIPHPSSTLNKHLGILILIAVRKQLTNEVTSWPLVTMSVHIRVGIQSGVCCKCVLAARSCTGRCFPGGPCWVLSGAAGWRCSSGEPEKASPAAPLAESSSMLMGPSESFPGEGDKVH